MHTLSRRLSKLEALRPAPAAAQWIDPHDLDPAVLALWLTVDINEMTLSQLEQFEENLKRLS
jgi:hypothetical protein